MASDSSAEDRRKPGVRLDIPESECATYGLGIWGVSLGFAVLEFGPRGHARDAFWFDSALGMPHVGLEHAMRIDEHVARLEGSYVRVRAVFSISLCWIVWVRSISLFFLQADAFGMLGGQMSR